VAKREKPPAPKKPRELEQEVRDLLAQRLSDVELRAKLEAVASEQAFNALTYLWGPALYRRNRVLFRPFILNHFASLLRTGWNWKAVRWKDHAASLDAWLDEVDRRDDAELFQRLYTWKHPQRRSGWAGLDPDKWREDLLARYMAVTEPYQRAQVLHKFDIRDAELDEETALALYEADPAAARPFILKHTPGGRWGDERKLPAKLCEAALRYGDEELYFPLYRQMVPQKMWEQDVVAVAAEVRDPRRLVEELEKRHPVQTWQMDLSGGFYALAKARGRDVVPYLMKHLVSLWMFSGGGKKKNKLLELAHREGWWDLWGVLVRREDNNTYNEAVLALVEDDNEPEEVLFRRLVLLSGASSQWNWGRFAWEHVQALKDKTAVALYERFPELAHGPFRKHLVVASWSGDLPKFTAAVLKKDDHALIDHLASQVVPLAHPYQLKHLEKLTGRLLTYYEELRAEPAAFARRVASVLGQVPAYSLGRRSRQLLENNALARLFLVDSAPALLEDGRAVRDLLEASEIHVQLLALRVLRQDDDLARQLAAENLDLLQATLLLAMHRKSRVVALEALANAATEANARQILARARQALDLPETGYPREHLLSLVAELYRRWPELRGPREQPVVYRARTKQRPWAAARPSAGGETP
jgi:hypothetical protein